MTKIIALPSHTYRVERDELHLKLDAPISSPLTAGGNSSVGRTYENVELAPFIGYHNGTHPMLCFGLIAEDGSQCHVWGISAPAQIITTWRGLQILDHLKHIDDYTMRDIFTVAQRSSSLAHSSSSPTFVLNSALFHLRCDYPEIDALRQTLLDQKFTDPDAYPCLELYIAQIISACEQQNIPIATSELTTELMAGTIHCSGAVQHVLNPTDLAALRQFSQTALPPEQSFYQFCRTAKIKGLLLTQECADAGCNSLMTIDRAIVYRSLSRNEPCKILCTGRDRSGKEILGNPVLRFQTPRSTTVRRLLRVHYAAGQIVLHSVRLDNYPGNIVTQMTLTEATSSRIRMIGIMPEDADSLLGIPAVVPLEPWWRRIWHSH